MGFMILIVVLFPVFIEFIILLGRRSIRENHKRIKRTILSFYYNI